MPRTQNLQRFYSQFALPSVKNYIIFSAILFFSGFYYYYRIIRTFNQEFKIHSQEAQSGEDDSENIDEFTSVKRLALFMRKHKLLFFVLLNTCCAVVALMGKILANFFFGTLSNQEESYIRKYMRRYIQTKITFLIFISHHNLLEDIFIWTPWLAIQILCLLLLELTTLRMTNAYNIIANVAIRRKMFAVSSITGLSSLFMVLFVFSISDNINIHYRLFLACDCFIVFIQSLHILCSLFILHDANVQNQQRQGGSYYLDLAYGLLRDCLEFVNYLHMIFYSQLAITYCCVFLIIQAQFYYSRIATKIRKHWQQREIINHINNSYSPASEEDLLKNEQCLICWQAMKSARKLPCAHIFHEHCLRRWLEQDSSCAICRKSLSLNLNNLRQQQNIVRVGDDMNQTMQMLFEAFSPQNSRVTRWWSRFLFDTMNEEQVTVMVNQVSEMFPQISMDIVRQIVINTGSAQATIDAILEGNVIIQNNPIGENNRGNEDGQRNLVVENDEESSSDESYSSSEEENARIRNVEVAAGTNHSIFLNDQSNQPNFLKTKNSWLNSQMEKMLAINRSNYLQSKRGHSLRVELENLKKES